MKCGAEQSLSSKKKEIKIDEQIIQDVPDEIWQVIFAHLPPSFSGMVRQASTEWYVLVQNLSQQLLRHYFSYLMNHPDYQTRPLRLFIKEYQQYQQFFSAIPMDAILSVLEGNTESIVSEANPVFQKRLYGLRFAKGYRLPEKDLSEKNILEIKGWAIFFAAWQGNTKLLEKLLILQGINARYKNKALFSAVHNGHVEVIAQLAALGADVNKPKNDGATPVYIAAQEGDLKMIVQLAALGADVNVPNNNGATPTFIAAQEGHFEVIAQLAALGANVNTPKNDGITPVYIAAQEGHFEVIAQLAALGADVNAPSNVGATPTPTFIAAQKGHAKVVQSLLNVNVKIQPYISSVKSLSNFAQSRGGMVIDRMDQLIQEKIEEGNHVKKIPLLPSEIAYIMGHDEIVNIFKTSSEVVTAVGEHPCLQPPAMTYVFNAKRDHSSSSSEENTLEIEENNHERSFFSINYCRQM